MRKSKFYGSLLIRVLFIFLVFVVLPFVCYVGFLWNHSWKLKLANAFSDMEWMGDFSYFYLQQWREETLAQLEEPFLLGKNFSTLLQFNRDLECIYSSQSSLIGRKDLFPKALQEAYHLGTFLFVDTNPVTKRRELFLLHRKEEELFALSVDLEKWTEVFSSLRHVGYPATLSFVTSQEETLFTVGQIERGSQDNLIEWNPSELKTWQQNAGIREWMKLRGKDLALIVPLSDAAFELMISLSSEQIVQYEGGRLFTHVLTLLSLLVLLGGGGAFWLISRISKPLGQLYGVMEKVGQEDYSKRYHPDRFGFEINTLGENFNQMLNSLLHNMEKAEKEKLSRGILSRELEIGRAVQKELLPKEIPEFSGVSVGVNFQPAKEVAGDFYDLFARSDQELFLAIADASDKGVSACLYSLIVRSMLRSYVLAGEDLKGILQKSNQLFCKDTGFSGNFVTTWAALFRADTYTLHYSSAGHLPALLIRPEGTIEELSSEGVALGVLETPSIEVKSISLTAESLLCLYSDGVTEAHNEKGEIFGKHRLFDFLRTHHKLPPQALADALAREVDQFAGGFPQHDDLTIVTIKWL